MAKHPKAGTSLQDDRLVTHPRLFYAKRKIRDRLQKDPLIFPMAVVVAG